VPEPVEPVEPVSGIEEIALCEEPS
jgi:hypothetical protein